ncbi:tail fiber domain-containing protein [Maritimibacter sp. DP1N21-5]|uniref:tail fiber domain-containing protein n=1 Tax=Maritimibacter sp. DP1N21-5 TaxID=2836867 RepID=UPI001C48D4A1|nr:tail fiber domain-containing protein [Maritimibacter sp. DP1N21-5]MBV7408770.1 tail fiber domain-containing protein [Maritimibacter sp. DP1N21-5]
MASAPKPDKNIGIAAKKSAQTGERHQDWMEKQAKITNAWAAEDRARYKNTFIPLQDELIADAQGYDTPERRAAAAAQAEADTQQQITLARQQEDRRLAGMGVSPDSGRADATAQSRSVQSGLATAGAREMARRQVETEGLSRKAAAVNMGQGLAVNPGTSIGLSNGAASSGASAAMTGYGQQGSLLNQDYQNRMQTYQANSAGIGSLLGGIGRIAGVFATGGLGAPLMLSSKEAKTDKTPVREGAALEAVNAMPVEEWTYKPGMGDEGRHIGPYAEDFADATGKGDGRSIGIIDAVGVTMAAVKDLSRKVDQMERMAA